MSQSISAISTASQDQANLRADYLNGLIIRRKSPLFILWTLMVMGCTSKNVKETEFQQVSISYEGYKVQIESHSKGLEIIHGWRYLTLIGQAEHPLPQRCFNSAWITSVEASEHLHSWYELLEDFNVRKKGTVREIRKAERLAIDVNAEFWREVTGYLRIYGYSGQ